mgnify:CR=1 FL=1
MARLEIPTAPLLVAGVWDGLSAALARDTGFGGVFLSGFAVAASLGLPDADLYTREDMTRATAVVARASGLPVIADMDTGWGDATSAWHATRAFEAAGAAAGPLADQSTVSLVPVAAAAAKIRACVAGRLDPDTRVVARTNARDNDEVVARLSAYAAAGADVVFPMRHDEGFGLDGWRALSDACPGVPVAAAAAPGSWLEANVDPSTAQELGITVLIHSLQGVLAAAGAIRGAFADIAAGRSVAVSAGAARVRDVTDVVGLPALRDLQHRFST